MPKRRAVPTTAVCPAFAAGRRTRSRVTPTNPLESGGQSAEPRIPFGDPKRTSRRIDAETPRHSCFDPFERQANRHSALFPCGIHLGLSCKRESSDSCAPLHPRAGEPTPSSKPSPRVRPAVAIRERTPRSCRPGRRHQRGDRNNPPSHRDLSLNRSIRVPRLLCGCHPSPGMHRISRHTAETNRPPPHVSAKHWSSECRARGSGSMFGVCVQRPNEPGARVPRACPAAPRFPKQGNVDGHGGKPFRSGRDWKVARANQLLVDELLDPHVSELAFVTGVLDASEG